MAIGTWGAVGKENLYLWKVMKKIAENPCLELNICKMNLRKKNEWLFSRAPETWGQGRKQLPPPHPTPPHIK